MLRHIYIHTHTMDKDNLEKPHMQQVYVYSLKIALNYHIYTSSLPLKTAG